jgi:tRNA threonylcarbamoyladenosine biosynthesis protein TsaE
MKTTTTTVEATRALGASFAARARPGDCLVLEGDLGAGKTEFVRGFVAALSGSAAVHSPSFSLLNIYQTPCLTVYHFDFYRLAHSGELVEIGFDDYVSSDGVCLIEWGTLFPDVLPPHAVVIRFRDRGDGVREVETDAGALPLPDEC